MGTALLRPTLRSLALAAGWMAGGLPALGRSRFHAGGVLRVLAQSPSLALALVLLPCWPTYHYVR